MNYEIVILGVNYCTSDQTIEWMRSIRKQNRGNNILITVVDTSAEKTDETLEAALKIIDPEVLYLNPRQNLGYFGGARYGLNYMTDNHILFDSLIVSNVDLRFETENLAEVIHSYDQEKTGVLAPTILSGEKDMNPYKMERMTKAQQERRIQYLQHPYLQRGIDFVRKLRKKKNQEINWPDGQKIYMGYGACIIFMRRYFDLGGDLNLPLFLYGEEPYVAEMCLKLNLDMIYAPRILVRDIGGASTSKIPSKKHREYLIESARYCIREFYH